MARLKISLFGPFHVILDGVVLTQFRSDAIRALFAYLVMDSGTAYRREALAGMFWPDKPEASALHNLRQGLNVLRQLLGDKKSTHPFLTVTRKEVKFDADRDYWLDTQEFSTQLKVVKESQSYRLWGGPQSIDRLQKLVDLYRGDFLSGFSLNSIAFEEWMVAKREQFHHEALEVFSVLANYHERRETYRQAQRYARRQIELEPWREESHRQLMRSLALDNQRNAALLQYKKCQEILEIELGIHPQTQTTTLYEQIKSGQFNHLRHTYRRHLPVQRTPFIGREDEIEELINYLVNPVHRLITLVGEGGIGKTRLSLVATEAVAAGFTEGACFVSLANLAAKNDNDQNGSSDYVLATAIGNALDLQFQSNRTIDSQLLAYLRPKELLLVLDSFEYLLPAYSRKQTQQHKTTYNKSAELILRILQSAPQVVVLVTSRTRLNFQAESVIQLGGLPIPSTMDAHASTYSSVSLFVERAQRTWPVFTLDQSNLAHVIRICQLVEGNPLGIELAAVWVDHFTPAEMVLAIQEDLDFLADTRQDIPVRHRSMRVVFEQSWKLLNEAEQHAFCQLCIFQGDFDRKAARQVANTSVINLSSLMNKSFIHRSEKDRYYIHDRLKDFGRQKLAAMPKEEEESRRRHAIYFMTWLEQQSQTRHYKQTLSKMAREIKNIRLAWQWAVEQADIASFSASLDGLFYFYQTRSWFQEGEACFSDAAQSTERYRDDHSRWHDKLVARQGVFCHHLGRYNEAKVLLQRSLEHMQALNDQYETAFCLMNLARVTISQGEYITAKQYLSEAIKLTSDIPSAQASRAACLALEADSRQELGVICWHQGDYAAAKRYYEQARRIYQNPRVGDQNGQAWALNRLGFVSWAQTDYAQAQHYYKQALQIFQQIGNQRGEGNTTNELGMVFERQGDYIGGKANYERALYIFHELGDQQGEGDTLVNLGFVAHHQGDYIAARGYFEQALDLFHLLGYQRGQGLALAFLSFVSYQLGNYQFAQEYAQQALGITQETGDRMVQGYSLTHLAYALMATGQYAEADQLYRQAIELRYQLGKPYLAIESLAGLASASLAQENFSQALGQVNEILHYLERNSLEGTVEPLRVYLTCIRVLQARQDPRAKEVSQRAYQLLKEQAAKVGSDQTQHTFWHQIPVHRELKQIFNKLSL